MFQDGSKGTISPSNNTQTNSSQCIHTPWGMLPCTWRFRRLRIDDDTQGERHYTRLDQNPAATLALRRQSIAVACNNLAKSHWPYSLPFQQFQALLTLFSKSFSPFPHGTCLLSFSNQFLALGEIYHPVGAPIPRNATLRVYTVHRGLQATSGTLTLAGAFFHKAYACASIGNTSSDYNSRSRTPISMLSLSLFIRHY